MNFDLNTAFAVREREDGLLEKDTFDLSTAVPVENTDPGMLQKVMANPNVSKMIDTITGGLSTEEANRSRESIVGPLVELGEVLTKDGIMPTPTKIAEGTVKLGQFVLSAMGRPVSGVQAGIGAIVDKKPAAEIVQSIIKGYMQPEEVKSLTSRIPYQEAEQGSWITLVPRATLEAIETYAVSTLVYGNVAGKIKQAYQDAKLAGVETQIDEITTKAANAIVKDPAKYKVTFPKDFTPEDQFGYTKAILSNRLQASPKFGTAALEKEGFVAKLKASLSSERGSVPIPKVGSTVDWKGQIGTIKEITGQRVIIALGKSEVVATLSQLSLPKVEEVKQPTEGKVSESLWHETNSNGLEYLMSYSDASGLNVSTDKTLALGQGGKGILVELNKDVLLGDRGSLAAIKKPGTEFVGQKEFRLIGGENRPGTIKSITIQKEVPVTPVQKAILNRQYNKVVNEDGSITFTPKLSTPTGEGQKPPVEPPKIIEPSLPVLETKLPEPPKETQTNITTPPETPIPPSELPPEGSMPQEPDPVKQVIQALKEAKPIRAEQEALMKAERGRRIAKAKAMGEKIGGEAGFRAQLGSLKGEMPKAQFETLRGKITQESIDTLFNRIRQSEINEWDKIGAQTGLGKLFGEFGGQVPTESELKLLNDIFGKEFTDALIANRTLLQKFMITAGEVLNVPRSVMASFDLSAPFRQGAFLIGNPKQFLPAFGEMFKFFGSEKALNELNKEILARPSYGLMREHKLALTDLGTNLSLREEKFMSNLAEKIPGVGIAIRASSRAYTGFLNKLRADVFDDLLNKARTLGIKETDKLLDDLAEFINSATGRGKLPGKLEKAAVSLNSIFFSPRLMASRINLLNPLFYTSKEPFVRKQALKSLLTFSGVWATLLGLMALGGAEIGGDFRSSDGGKAKIGNTRVDFGAGFQQYLRMATQLITGEYVSSATGKTLTLGEGYKPLTRFDIVLRQLENKEAPVASFITSLLRQQTFMGEDVNVLKEIGARFTPMVLSNLVELAQEDPMLLPLGVLGLFGVGVQTYENKSKLSSSGLSKTRRGLK